MIIAFTAGLLIGTVAGTVSWVAAAAYLEAQRLNPKMVEAMADAQADAELSTFTIERSFAFSPEQTAPTGRLYRYRKNHLPPTTSHASATKASNSSSL